MACSKDSSFGLRGADDEEEPEIIPTFVNSGEQLVVSSDETLLECTVHAGGTLVVESGANVETLHIEPGATLWVEPGCGISGLTIDGGAHVNGFLKRGYFEADDFKSDGAQGLSLGIVYVEEGFEAVIYGRQKVETCRVLEGGSLTVQSNAIFGTSLIVYAGGKINGLTAQARMNHLVAEVSPLSILGFEIDDGELLEYYKVECGDIATCYSGQTFRDLFVEEGACLVISKGGKLAGKLNLSGQLVLQEGALTSNLSIEAPIFADGSYQFRDTAVTIDAFQKASAHVLAIGFGANDRAYLVTASRSDGTKCSFTSEDGLVSIYVMGTEITLTASDDDGNRYLGEGIKVAASASESPLRFDAGEDDGVQDVFLARVDGVWKSRYIARHEGSLVDGDVVGVVDASAAIRDKNRIQDIFTGAAADASVLLLTDDENGDALFVDDIFSNSFESMGKTQARLANITEIIAGAGGDVIDFTSSRFAYVGAGVTVRGGEGDDVMWANGGKNYLFGDAGNDSIIGGCDDDVIVGGAGNDSLNGNGGEDIFCFGAGWGEDEVNQCDGGKVILWFAEGLEVRREGQLFTCNDNTVTVCDGVEVKMKVGDDASGKYAQLCSLGAFR